MRTDLLDRLRGKQSSPINEQSARTGNAMAFAHYLGLPESITAAAKSAPAKVKAVAAKLTRKPAASSAPASNTPAPAPAARTTAPSATSTAPTTSQSVRDAIKADRARARRIIETGMKLGATNQAIVLAFDTPMSAAEAVAALKASQMDRADQQAGAQRHGSYRMDVRSAGATGSEPQFDPKIAADQIIAAGEKASGQTAALPSSNRTANRIVSAGALARGE